MSHDFTLAAKPVPDCPPVTAPVVVQYDVTHAAGEGTAPVAPAELTIAAGSAAAFGGKIALDGCDSVTAVITYLTGGDCDNCTPDTITTQDVTVVIPAGATDPIPDGYWQAITYTVNDGAGVSAGNSLHLHALSACQPSPCCVVTAI